MSINGCHHMEEISLNSSLTVLKNIIVKNDLMHEKDQILNIETPGAGNMNVVLRVITQKGSFILKQSRNYVNKYPQIPAPINRIDVEAQFYQLIHTSSCSHYLPRLLRYDQTNKIIFLEDLGRSSDYQLLYKKNIDLSQKDYVMILYFLHQLHNISFSESQSSQFPKNLALRRLNHQHLFVYPYSEKNNFDLNDIKPGLQQLAQKMRQDTPLKKAAIQLGKKYLSEGTSLLHGDYYPGSWLKTKSGFHVIDPEFCFFGPKEYDLGVLRAHLKMAEQPISYITDFWKHYPASDVNSSLVDQFEGMELIRRIIGLAQLPLNLSLEKMTTLLQEGKRLLMVS